MKIKGYKRENGKVGIRNHLLVLPTSVCAAHTAVKIADQISEAVAIPHEHGCCQLGPDEDQTTRTLIGLGKNPNVGSVLVVGLGCEGVEPDNVAEEISKTGKRVEKLVIQKEGGTLKTIEAGTRIARNMANELAKMEREDVDLDNIVLGIECGGTDATSGIAANPAVGGASDKLLEFGGTAMLSETTELIGAEHVLAERAINEDVKNRLFEIVNRTEKRALDSGVDLRGNQPTPGNIQGGVTTIEEKSLGCIYKAGSADIQGILEYAEEVENKGFYVMDTPGQDIDSITGMLAGGAQIIVFTTGRGTPTGSPIAPVIKVTGNSRTYKMMEDNIDINAGRIIDESVPMSEVSEEIFDYMVRVANGEKPKAELLGHKEFGIFRIAPTV
ncbi:UxaA family hydrolase [Halanaerobium congolense]|uniref:UxaA family hydrolase n=1 Tax=Halanaerobium congolense TaxID=54121 RepID=UPI0008872F23|nr:UxaA family hydrolase [Halanaerobium congolense]PUU88167.1 MAG: altronate dehydratase [Halanaerobium sp.]SDK76506.1 altronate dehydratase large subunit [Halanaerobium congolense]SDM49309.1 altronate dehydratase large subunit [Halanaerobium congolense]